MFYFFDRRGLCGAMNTAHSKKNGFDKSQRLLRPCDFACVFDGAKKTHSVHFLLLSKKSDAARLGLAISKKRLKNACDRNLVKRLARECFRLQQTPPKADCVLVVKKTPPKTADKAAYRRLLREEIGEVFAKLSAKNAPPSA